MNLIPLPVWDAKKSKKELKDRIAYYQETNPTKFIYAVVKKEDETLIGGCAIVDLGELNFEIGYRFIEDYWGNGFGSEIAEGLIKFSFKSLNATRVYAEAYVNNLGSQKILSKYMQKMGDFYSEQYQCHGIQYEVFK